MFPEELRKRAVEIGQVLKMDMYPSDRVSPKGNADHKEKRFVIVGKHEDSVVAALLINSRINTKLFNRIGPYQHLIMAEKYEFLGHDSYIDGYSLREFEVSRVLMYAQYLGSIDEDDLSESIKHVLESPDVKPYMIKKFRLR